MDPILLKLSGVMPAGIGPSSPDMHQYTYFWTSLAMLTYTQSTNRVPIMHPAALTVVPSQILAVIENYVVSRQVSMVMFNVSRGYVPRVTHMTIVDLHECVEVRRESEAAVLQSANRDSPSLTTATSMYLVN